MPLNRKTALENRLPCPLASIVFIIAFVAYAFTANGIFVNPDTPWHLATGDWILTHRHIPFSNPWAFAGVAPQWLNMSWLWDIVISIVFQTLGAKGLYLFTCAFGALNLAVLAGCMKARNQVLDTYIILMAVLTGLAQYIVLFPQPQLATFLFAVLFHHHMHHHVLKRRSLAVLPLMMVLWVNLHGGFIIGFTILAAYAIEAYEKGDKTFLTSIVKLGFACMLACLVNPYNIHIVEAENRTLNSVITAYLGDWHPVTFGNLAISAPLFFFILTSNVRDPGIRLADKILAFVWLLAGLAAVRNFIIFTLVGAPYFCYCLQGFARATQGVRFRSANILSDTWFNRLCYMIIAGVCIIVLPTDPMQRLWMNAGKTDTDPQHLRPAINSILTRYPDVRFLNDYNLGGGLIYVSDGKWRVFVDGRAGTAYSESLLQDAIDFQNGDGNMATAILGKYKAQGIILLKSGHRALQLPASAGHWQQVYANDTIVAYVKN